MNKTRVLTLAVVILFFLSAFLGISLWRCMHVNRDLAKKIPFITSKEKIEDFNLTGVDESRVTLQDLKNQNQSLVFIFSRPCTPCNQNLVFWNKIAQIVGDKVNIYGIILNDLTEAYNFAKDGKLEFKVYVPDNLESFKQSWKIQTDQAKTILMNKDRPALTYLGNLEAEITSKFIAKTRELMKQGSPKP